MGAFFVLTFIFIFVGLIVWVAKLVFKIDVSDWFQACENLFLAEHRVGIFDILIMCAIAVVISLIVSFVFSLVYAIVLAVKKNLKL
jgi:hypothetical protein